MHAMNLRQVNVSQPLWWAQLWRWDQAWHIKGKLWADHHHFNLGPTTILSTQEVACSTCPEESMLVQHKEC